MSKRHQLRRSESEENICSVDKSLRTIYIIGEITAKVASTFRKHVRTLERARKFKTITVEINSPGGDVEAGLAIIDTIQTSRKRIITRVTGVAMSMGSLILASGDRREALPRSTIMVHQGSYGIRAAYDEMENEFFEVKRVEKLCDDFMDEATGAEPGYWSKRCGGKNLYLTAELAVKEGIIDRVVRKTNK